MFLDLIPALNAFIILGSMLVIGRNLARYFKNEQEYNRLRDDRFEKTIEEINAVLVRVFEMETLIIEHQTAIVEMITDLNKFRNDQQENFDALARADMLSARREELLRSKELKIALERLMGVAMTSRQPPAPNDVIALENLTKRIEELEAILK
jgi:hypothetical protein